MNAANGRSRPWAGWPRQRTSDPLHSWSRALELFLGDALLSARGGHAVAAQAAVEERHLDLDQPGTPWLRTDYNIVVGPAIG